MASCWLTECLTLSEAKGDWSSNALEGLVRLPCRYFMHSIQLQEHLGAEWDNVDMALVMKSAFELPVLMSRATYVALSRVFPGATLSLNPVRCGGACKCMYGLEGVYSKGAPPAIA